MPKAKKAAVVDVLEGEDPVEEAPVEEPVVAQEDDMVTARWMNYMRGKCAGKARFKDDTFQCTRKEAEAAGADVVII